MSDQRIQRASDAIRVTIVGHTQLHPEFEARAEELGYEIEEGIGGGEVAAEFGGRACYQSFSKPNPATATNAGYLNHILDVGHLSVLEHGTVTLYVEGTERATTHELIRHRHLSPSQLSQRYVGEEDTMFVEPDIIANDPAAHAVYVEAVENARRAYGELVEILSKKTAEIFDNNTDRRKNARQAARAVLPNATETRLQLTGNYRAWRHFLRMRGSEHADVSIRLVAVAVYKKLVTIAPSAFGDITLRTHIDGTEVLDVAHVEP